MATYAKKKSATNKGNAASALPTGATQVEQDKEHETLISYVNEADDSTIASRELSEKSRSYYDSQQWTDAEKSKLKAQKQAATVINRCKPKVDSLMGMEHANRTTAKAQPRTPKHAKGASAATEAVRFVLQDNMYQRHRSDAWENLLIEGTGGVEIIVKAKDEKKKKESGAHFKIIVRQIMWDRLIYDPHSRRKDFSDAKYLGQVVWMDYDDAIALYPDAQDVLEAMQSGSQTYDDKPRWLDQSRRRVKVVEMYYRKADGDWWYACFTRGGYCKAPMKSPYVNEEGETEHCYEFASLFVGRDGDRYGSLKQLLDVQDEINKRRSKALHLMSVRQTFGNQSAVPDLNKARQELAKPDGHLETAYGEFGKDFGILPTGDMAQAQFNLLTEAKMEIDSVGANAATMGKDKTVQSGVALRQRALTGQTELAPMFDILKNLDIRVYRKVWNRIKQYWKEEMWLRVTDDENNLKFVGLNRPMTNGQVVLEGAKEQKLPPEALQALEQKIAQDPTMAEQADMQNDIVHLDVDIVMDDAPDTVTQEVEDFQAMAEMVKSGFPLPPKAVIMASPLSNKDKILKMMDEQPQLPPEHVEQMKKMQEQMAKLAEENQALKADQQTEQAKMQLSAQEGQAKLQQRQVEQQAELALQQQKQQAEAALAQAKAEAEFALKKYVAEQELALSQMKCDNDAQMNERKLAMQSDENERKAQSEVKTQQMKESETAMPQFMQALRGIMEQFAAVVESNAKANAEIVSQLSKPKTVTLGGIKRNEDGISGASATVQ